MSVEVTRDADGIAWIELCDTAGDNGLSPALIDALLDALGRVSADRQVRVVLLAGTRRWFCSGATRSTLASVKAHRIAPADLVLGRRVLDVPVPVVAAVEGDTLGGGLALMLSADLLVVARESRHAANFMALGITPGMGITHLLSTVLGAPLAHELLYTGRSIRGDALPPGSVNAVVGRDGVRDAASEIAWRIADKDRDNLRLLKRSLSLPRRRALEEAMTMESLMHESSLARLDEGQLG